VVGLAYLVPKPEPDHGYVDINGDVEEPTAIAEPSVLKDTLSPIPAGNVEGLAYLVPKPEPDHGYADTDGEAR
jgi:hypothetical protein